MIKDYFLQNWGLILVLLAFVVTIHTTVFVDKKTAIKLDTLISYVFFLSIVVYSEFLLADLGQHREIRIVLMAVRYASTPLIIAQIIFTLVKKQRWFVFLPAIGLSIINFISIFTGIVFKIDESNNFSRGPLGYLPFIMVGLYSFFLIFILIHRSNKRSMEMIPIIFLTFALGSSLIMPFVVGSKFSQIFCTTIAIAIYVYYVFQILMLTKLDSLTGLLNRQAYYADISNNPEDITAVVSVDMNGLKAINDNQGHAAGDDALVTLAICFLKALRSRISGYRIGGDEFVFICRKCSEKDVLAFVERMKKHVSETKFTCSVGYALRTDVSQTVDEILKISDEMMYAAKAEHYVKSGERRRR